MITPWRYIYIYIYSFLLNPFFFPGGAPECPGGLNEANAKAKAKTLKLKLRLRPRTKPKLKVRP